MGTDRIVQHCDYPLTDFDNVIENLRILAIMYFSAVVGFVSYGKLLTFNYCFIFIEI